MKKLRFTLNKQVVEDDIDDDSKPLLWYLREDRQLTGTKYGCGIGRCGACSVHLNGKLVRSCSLPISNIQGQQITTIEGLSDSEDELHPLQQAWVKFDVPQCGYCQAGQLMAASAMLKDNPQPSDTDIDQHMVNLCRCGTYQRIRDAIKYVSLNSSNKEMDDVTP